MVFPRGSKETKGGRGRVAGDGPEGDEGTRPRGDSGVIERTLEGDWLLF